MSAYEYFPTGTCSNEALHREINQCISYKIMRYETTIDQMVRGFHFAKVIAHAAAVFGTPTRQLKQGILVQHSVGAMRFWTYAQRQHFCKRINSHTFMGGPVNDEVKRQSIMRTKVRCVCICCQVLRVRALIDASLLVPRDVSLIQITVVCAMACLSDYTLFQREFCGSKPSSASPKPMSAMPTLEVWTWVFECTTNRFNHTP